MPTAPFADALTPDADVHPHRNKLMTAREAVDRFVDDGDVVYTGYSTQVPYALTHEIIRRRRRNLDVVGASLGPQVTQLVLAGCCSRVRTGYISGALRPGPLTEMMASGALQFEDYSNGAIAVMLMAGAMRFPFVPMKWFLGSDYLKPENRAHAASFLGEAKWRVIDSPFDGDRYLALPALRPDVTMMHFQRADVYGNVQGWGALGDARWALWAAEKVIVSVEEIVPTAVVRRDPSRTLVPGARVAAVVHAPGGAHPTAVAGYYDSDYSFIRLAALAYEGRDQFDAFAAEWIYGRPDRAAYMGHLRERFGDAWIANITPAPPLPPLAPIDYSFAPHLGWMDDPEGE